MCIKVSKKLANTTWNVNGLYKRISSDRICKLDDKIIDHVMNDDIVTFSETHIPSKEILMYDGYACFVNCRHSESRRSRGVKLIDTSTNDLMWFKLDKDFFGFERNVFLCFLYILPSNSSYTLRTNFDKQIFEKLEGDIIKYHQKSGDIMLMGDVNAHINNNDLYFIRDEVDYSLDNFLPSNYIADSVCKFRNTQIHQITNKYGKLLLELCTESQLRILNRRTLGDSKGNVTFYNHNGVSIDDYCICSSEFLQNILNLRVGQYEPTISDHCPISVDIQCQSVKKTFNNLKASPKRMYWNKAREDIFKTNLSNVNFKTINSELDNITQPLNNTEHVSTITQRVNDNVSDISSLLYNAAFFSNNEKNSTRIRKGERRKIKKKLIMTMNVKQI